MDSKEGLNGNPKSKTDIHRQAVQYTGYFAAGCTLPGIGHSPVMTPQNCLQQGESRGVERHYVARHVERELSSKFFSFFRSLADGIRLQTLTLLLTQKAHSHQCFVGSQH